MKEAHAMPLASTKDRVPEHTADEVNERIRTEAMRRVEAVQGRPELVANRLKELDEEWDIERAIETNASTLAFVGTALGFFAHPYWLILPGLVTAFLFQHAVQGWCPPVPVLRRLGFRTMYEIAAERNALKALRGDYQDAHLSSGAALRAAEA
jgi:hypothetical protein